MLAKGQRPERAELPRCGDRVIRVGVILLIKSMVHRSDSDKAVLSCLSCGTAQPIDNERRNKVLPKTGVVSAYTAKLSPQLQVRVAFGLMK